MPQLSIRFAAPGTRNYTVGNDVVGGVMKMEAIGAGGAGGTATVNSGGGGKGGAYARRNAQAVTAGQSLTVTVPASSAAAAGAVATVGTGGGSSGTIGTQSFTVTGGASGGTTGRTATVKHSGPINFVASNTSTATGAITIPATAQIGDTAYVCGYTSNNRQTPAGFVSLHENLNFFVFYKIIQNGDAGASYRFDVNDAATYAISCVVYRGQTADPQFVSSKTGLASTGPLTADGFTATTSDFALFFCGTVSQDPNSPAQISPPAGVTERVEARATGTSRTVTANDAALTQVAGTTLLSARGGNVGGNGSATAGGTGATAQNGTFVGDVEFTGGNGANGTLTAGGRGGGGAGDASNTTGAGPNTQFGVSRGTGGLSAADGQVFGGGGGGATTLAGRGAGASGIVVLTYTSSTASATTSVLPVFSRRITAFRRVVNSVLAIPFFSRLVTYRRRVVASVAPLARLSKFIRNRKIASVTPAAIQTRKALRLARSAGTSLVSVFTRRIQAFRRSLGTTTATPVFRRLVTLRRRLVASVQARAKMLVKLEARLIPREGGGGTVTNVFRNLFLFDD